MSHAPILALSAGLPSRRLFCPPAGAPRTTTIHRMSVGTAHSISLRMDVFHHAIGLHPPALNRIIMIALPRRILRFPCGMRGLHVPALVGGKALQDRGSAIPVPAETEPHQTLR